ncbi:TMEM165/GDT1 family protein [Actinokineospora sp.]|uniref:TMEM165/GDT1 family protein n=1 Tax=Actinokineospora sp. TaxID=1872133 RepID=UPI004037CF6B
MIAFASAFALVFVVELPDKTLVATLILTTRYRAWPVFVGVSAAFALQVVIAAAFGGVLTLLPEQAVAAVVALLFASGAFLLLREGFSKQVADTVDQGTGTGPVSFPRAALTSFGVLFAAEWGDASQIATAGLSARYAEPVLVGLGAWLALVSVAGIAVLVGKRLAERIRAHLIQRVAGLVFAAFAVFAGVQAIA